MNFASILYILGTLVEVEGALFIAPALVALFYREPEGLVYLFFALVCAIAGRLTTFRKVKQQIYYAKEGFVSVALGWIIMSVVGCIPFMLTGEIPGFTDALFETVSGFTTTGSSILSNVEGLSHCSLFWRSFTHWIGGMGVFVFILAILPKTGAQNMHLLRSESPGPEVGKLVPKIGDSAKILYVIYFGMTVIQIIILLITRMPLFDAVTLTFGTAGTGGFGIKNSSIADYTYVQQLIIGIFMLLFGVNFNFYFFILIRHSLREAVNMDEVKTYFAIVAASTVLIMLNARSMFGNMADAFGKAFFQVSSIITTTGFSTADFNEWPAFSKTILVCLMFTGACAGSTGGGFKISRLIIMAKAYVRELIHFIHPRLVKNIYMDKRKVKNETVSGVMVYLASYVLVFLVSLLVISTDGFDPETNFTAVMATLNNIGPGLSTVGPAGNFDHYSDISKFVLTFDMLAGRLELYPMLLLFSPGTWRKR
ncbi:MAG: TrkH family potassium uptake protein [Lachnospiraceae bacterium]|nr:TrkH family potassium uptake protein [Lachnospiraceae bacterium]